MFVRPKIKGQINILKKKSHKQQNCKLKGISNNELRQLKKEFNL